jgi:hypothetical protein
MIKCELSRYQLAHLESLVREDVVATLRILMERKVSVTERNLFREIKTLEATLKAAKKCVPCAGN